MKPEGRGRAGLTRASTTFISDYTAPLSGVYAPPPRHTDQADSALRDHCSSQTPPTSSHRRPHPPSPLLQHLGLSSEVYSPSEVSVEISRAGSVRRPRPEEALERRRGALALERLPPGFFEGGEGERKENQ